MYSKKLLKYFNKPKHVGKIENADGVGIAGNPICGDQMRMYIKVKSPNLPAGRQGSKVKSKVITDAKFETLGCGAAIAMSERAIELVKGKTIDEVLKIKPEDIASGFDLPKEKIHCSVLGAEALRRAIEDYQRKVGG